MALIVTTLLHPTNTRGTRIRADVFIDGDKKSVTVGYDYSKSDIGARRAAAHALLVKLDAAHCPLIPCGRLPNGLQYAFAIVADDDGVADAIDSANQACGGV